LSREPEQLEHALHDAVQPETITLAYAKRYPRRRKYYRIALCLLAIMVLARTSMVVRNRFRSVTEAGVCEKCFQFDSRQSWYLGKMCLCSFTGKDVVPVRAEWNRKMDAIRRTRRLSSCVHSFTWTVDSADLYIFTVDRAFLPDLASIRKSKNEDLRLMASYMSEEELRMIEKYLSKEELRLMEKYKSMDAPSLRPRKFGE